MTQATEPKSNQHDALYGRLAAGGGSTQQTFHRSGAGKGMTGNDDKRHLHTKRQQVPETVTHIFTMLIGVCGVNQSAITNVSNVSNMAKISGSGSHRLTKRVIKRDMRPIINHPLRIQIGSYFKPSFCFGTHGG